LEIELGKGSETLVEEFTSLSSPQGVARLLEIPYGVLNYHLYIVPVSKQYTIFSVPKKAGGVREICAPVTTIKIIQKKLNRVLQNVYEHMCRRKHSVHGFVYGKNVRTNAQVHTSKEYVFNIDLLDFFPSINFGRVYGMFMGKPYRLPQSVARVLARICCYKDSNKDYLPQGSPTSPIVSNMICAKLDNELYRYARRLECKYTRYADDISFSTDRPNFPVELAVITTDPSGGRSSVTVGTGLNSIIEQNGFLINTRKVWIQHRRYRQKVTGLIVNEFPNVSRKYTSQIRAMLHAWDKYGLKSAEKEFLEKYDGKKRWSYEEETLFKQVVKGKINFLKMVRGIESPVYLKLAGQLAGLDPDFSVVFHKRTRKYSISEAVWILEYCYNDSDGKLHCKQSTAFNLKGLGLVTCAHAVDDKAYVFKPSNPSAKYPVKVVRSDMDIDLSVLSIEKRVEYELVRGDPHEVEIGTSIKVLGFPNYTPGKTIQLFNGKVTGKKPYKTIQRINVDAIIAAGNSGGPVFNEKDEVIGVAVSGSEAIEEALKNENTVIPIDALDRLIAKTDS